MPSTRNQAAMTSWSLSNSTHRPWLLTTATDQGLLNVIDTLSTKWAMTKTLSTLTRWCQPSIIMLKHAKCKLSAIQDQTIQLHHPGSNMKCTKRMLKDSICHPKGALMKRRKGCLIRIPWANLWWDHTKGRCQVQSIVKRMPKYANWRKKLKSCKVK